MYQNKIYDVIIIGASEEGLALSEYLMKRAPTLKLAIVSKNFNNLSEKHKLDNVLYLQKEVIFSSYMRGLIGFTLADRTNIYCTNAVIATGSTPEHLAFESNNIYYKIADVKNTSKSRQVIVLGEDREAIQTAEWAAKKFRYVYLCSKSMRLAASQKELDKLARIENIVHLPNCYPVSFKNDNNGNLVETTLSTYDTIRSDAIIAITKRKPDIPRLYEKMIEIRDGYIVINHFGETPIISKIFALGACTKYTSKRNITTVGRRILSINGWKQED